MEYRRLGRSGLQISKLALGTMNFGNATPKVEAFQIIDRALDAGVNIFDCADTIPENSRGAFKQIYADRITQKGIEVAQKLAERAAAKGCTLA